MVNRFAGTSLAVAAFTCLQGAALFAQNNFISTVTATKPLAYYRLSSTSGQSQVGTSSYQATGSVGIVASGAVVPVPNARFLKLDGKSAYITTTQIGGVGTAASIMAWINLAALPSKTGHIFYVAGESQNGNDLDVQVDTDDQVKFWTAAGGHVSYAPVPASLLNQWHMIVATVDTQSQTRAIYWDGKQVASDKGGGEAGKTTAFTIGESIVFRGRFFQGSIDNAGLWNRALKASEVDGIYAASGAVAGSPAAGGNAPSTSSASSAPLPTTGPYASKAKVEVADASGPVKLKREEEIAYMFMSAFEIIEHNCQLTLQHVCPLDQLLSGAYGAGGSSIEHLKFDPNKTDPNYTYTLAANGMAWEAHANPKRAGLKAFCFMARTVGTTTAIYSNSAHAGWTDTELGDRGMEGDSFASQ